MDAKYQYYVTSSFDVLCLRNVVADGPIIDAEEKRTGQWEKVTLANTKLYDSEQVAYSEAIDACDCQLRSLERKKGEAREREIDEAEEMEVVDEF